MKKAILISIICTVMLTACGNAAETAERAESVETSAVSQTTTTASESTADADTTGTSSAKEEKDTSETTTTTRKSSQTVSETSASMETIKAKTTKKSTHTPQEQNEPQSYSQTEQPQENTEVNTTQKPATTTQQKQTTAKQTTTAPPKPATTTQKPQTTTQPTTTKPATKPESTVTWSDSMKAWRKLCEGKSLSGKEQDLTRSEILEYAESFNGKTDIHVSFGIDEYDISYEKPLNLTIRNDMTDLSYAHTDAYVDADSSWLIDYAGNEEEIYSIVSETRTNCLHVIDYGLFNRWEIYSSNNALKYAGDIEFNVGFDGTAIWFLTEN